MSRVAPRGLLLLLLGLVLAGCATPPPRFRFPLEEGAQVLVRDERPDAFDDYAGTGGSLLPLVPLVPWSTVAERRFLERSFAPAVVSRIKETNAFRQVLGPDDPYPERLEQPLELEVVLLSLGDRRRASTWLLGPAGAILWVVGVPRELDTAEASLRVVWRPRPGAAGVAAGEFETSGAARVTRPYLLYQDGAGAARARVQEALGRALDEAMREGVRRLRAVRPGARPRPEHE
ncbi:MAG: hypothetical protein AB7N76_13965 [Planctomycetota bacterium]